jgi:hypothetical protein
MPHEGAALREFEEQATKDQLAALKEARESGPFGLSADGRVSQGLSYTVAAIRAERVIVYTCPPNAGFFFRFVHNSLPDREARRAMVQSVIDRAQRGLENLYSSIAEVNGAPSPQSGRSTPPS